MKRITCLLLCFVLFSLCSARASRKLHFRKRVDPNNVPNPFNADGIRKFKVPGRKLVEGDISVRKKAGRNAYIKADKWPGGVVPFEIGAVFTADEKEMILNALSAITRSTNNCIKFVPRNGNTVQWVNVISGDGCYSSMGKDRQDGPQDLSLQQGGCTLPGTITHEFLHALGFAHEQTRPDADQYVRLYPENMQDGMLDQFTRFTASEINTFGEPYDYSSIMHYETTAFSKNGKPTMLPTQPVSDEVLRNMGNGDKMDDQDLKKLMEYYECQ